MTEPSTTAAPSTEATPPAGYTPPATQADLDKIIGTRLNQERAKIGGLTADQVAELREKAKRADEYDSQNATEIEKREKAARKAAEQEVRAQFVPQLAETAFRVAIGDRRTADEVNDFIGDLNLARFVGEDGRVDTVKVLARVEQFAPVKGTGTPPSTPTPRGPVVPGHNPGGPPTSNPGEGGRAAAERRGFIKAS